MHDPRVLTGRKVRLREKAAREQIATVFEIDLGQPTSDRGARLLGDFELDRPSGLPLDHGGAIAHPATGAHVVDLQRDEIAAAQLAVDREVEQGEVALSPLKLKPDPDRPDLLRLERAFLANQATLVPGFLVKTDNGQDRIMHSRLLDPDRARPSARRRRRRANVAERVGFSVTFRTIALAGPCSETRR